MNRMRNRRGGRGGFTLIELLVVIAIIAVLVGLISSAVMRAYLKGPETQARADINQLASAIGTFQHDFGVSDNIPSLIVLHETMANYNMSDPVQARSRAFLTKVFGRRLQAQIDWNNDGTINGPHTLYGEQALVFFLGGAQTSTPVKGCLGFSASPLDPINGSGTRKGPFFDFKSNRLQPGSAVHGSLNGFFVYLDPFTRGKPYVYFAPRTTNNYNITPLSPGPGYVTDSLITDYRGDQRYPVAPFREAPGGQFMNPRSFQIISAGLNTQFGDSTIWTVGNGYGGGGPGEDDYSNFSGRRLGYAQE